jgi:hypothetical protein
MFRHVRAGEPDPPVGHTVINIKAIRQAEIVAPTIPVENTTFGISPPSFSHLSIARGFKALLSPSPASFAGANDSGATEFHKAIAGWSVRSCS